MSDKPKLPPDKTEHLPNADHHEILESDKEKQPLPWWRKIDQSLLSTIALTVISLCALFVSIYQTRVLSMQQEVMAEQQRIMTENAKAQLWPNAGVGRYREFSEDGLVVDSLRFTIGNSGTGPAIIEKAAVRYKGRYVSSWGELYKLTNYPDTLSTVAYYGSVSSKVLSANQKSMFLGLSANRTLMEHMNNLIEEEGFSITICYRSVFNDYWLREHKFGQQGYDKLIQVDSCTIADSIAFGN